MKTIIRAFALMLGPVVFGAVIVPFGLWALDGFPDGDSHGLWIPVMFGMYIGLPGGTAVGLVSVMIYLVRRRSAKQKENGPFIEREPIRSSGPFEKY